MQIEPLPPELIELENQLRERSAEGPSAAFRNRVIAAAERASESRSLFSKWGPMHWSAAAAAILIVLNLSMIAASETVFSIGSPRDHVSVAQYLQILQQAEAQQNRALK